MEETYSKIGLSCAGIAVCGLILFTGPEPLEADAPDENPRVLVGDLKRSTIAHTVTAFGLLLPRQSLQLSTQVPGVITWVSDNLEAGAQVAKGDLLLNIDARDYAIAVASAEARFAQAEAKIEIERGRSEIAQLEWAAWQDNHVEESPASPLALRKPQQAEAVAHRRTIGAELDSARLALERTAVRAPLSGHVVQSNAIVGQVMPVGEVAATIFPQDYAVVELQVSMEQVQLLDEGIERIELRSVHDLDGSPIVGKFEGIVRNLTSDTRLATVRIRVDEPLIHSGWAYGMHLQAKLITELERNVVLIPADLIVSGNLVWISRGGRVHRQQLYPVEVQDQMVSVEDNFGPEDALVLERPIGLFDGASVVITER